MYKLVAVGGKLRGKEFVLEDGDNTVGRDGECDVHIPIQGVSKHHLTVTVTKDVAYVQDNNSSNGTFVNGKIVKRATVKNGDKIALPDTILQVVYVKEKKKIVKKINTEEVDEDVDPFAPQEPPSSLPQKVIYFFKYKFMSFIHGINEEYEWRVLIGILLAIFITITVTLTINPVLKDSKAILLHETALRGAHYANEIARLNKTALEQNNLDQINADFLKAEDGVKSFELYDLEGRIVAPPELRNEYISDPFSITTRDWALSTASSDGKVLKKLLDDGEIGIGKKIMAYNVKTGEYDPIGVVSIRFAPRSLAAEAAKSRVAYLEALVTSIIVAIVFFGIVYYLTMRPIDEIKYQVEEALRGKRRNVEGIYLMEEIDPLKNTINSLLQRIRELQNEGGDDDFGEMESDEPYVTSLVEFMRGAGVPVMVLDSEKNVASLNMEAEDLTGIRESASQGMSLLDVSREKGFAATVIDLCDSTANEEGANQQGEYELSGVNYTLNATCLLGKDNFAKAYYVTFIRDD